MLSISLQQYIVNVFFISLAYVFCKVGDGTNFVLVFAGALLDAAEELLRMVSLVVREQSKPESCQVIFLFLEKSKILRIPFQALLYSKSEPTTSLLHLGVEIWLGERVVGDTVQALTLSILSTVTCFIP